MKQKFWISLAHATESEKPTHDRQNCAHFLIIIQKKAVVLKIFAASSKVICLVYTLNFFKNIENMIDFSFLTSLILHYLISLSSRRSKYFILMYTYFYLNQIYTGIFFVGSALFGKMSVFVWLATTSVPRARTSTIRFLELKKMLTLGIQKSGCQSQPMFGVCWSHMIQHVWFF